MYVLGGVAMLAGLRDFGSGVFSNPESRSSLKGVERDPGRGLDFLATSCRNGDVRKDGWQTAPPGMEGGGFSQSSQ